MKKKTYSLLFSEPFLESVPQVHVLLVIATGSKTYQWQSQINKGVIDIRDTFFLATFCTSIFSAAFGMTKLLKVGPCSIVPRNKYGLGFFLSFLSILFGLVGKGLLLVFTVLAPFETHSVKKFGIGVCLGTCFFTPMVFVSTNFRVSQEKLYLRNIYRPLFSKVWIS